MGGAHFALRSLCAAGGLVLWAVHFAILYGFVGLACARGLAELVAPVIAAATALALAFTAVLFLLGWSRRDRGILGWLTAASAGAGAFAITLQATPVLFVPACG